MSYRNADGLRLVVWTVALLGFVPSGASAAVPAARPKFSVPVDIEPGPGPTPRFLARASGYRVLLDETGAAIISGRAKRVFDCDLWGAGGPSRWQRGKTRGDVQLFCAPILPDGEPMSRISPEYGSPVI